MTAIRVLSVGFLWLINLFPQPEDIVVWQKGYPSGDSYCSNSVTSTRCWNCEFPYILPYNRANRCVLFYLNKGFFCFLSRISAMKEFVT